jgi:hypothetical protein
LDKAFSHIKAFSEFFLRNVLILIGLNYLVSKVEGIGSHFQVLAKLLISFLLHLILMKNAITESQNAFKEQIATQFVSIFRRLLQDVPSSPEIFRQTSSLMLNKLSECALNSPQY